MMINEVALQSALRQMYRDGVIRDAIRLLFLYITKGKTDDLFNVNPNYIAKRLSLSKSQALNLIINGLKNGLFEMHWDIYCPQCHGIAHNTNHIHQIKSENYCERCMVNFENHGDENITVSISLNPNIVDKLPDDLVEIRKVDGRVPPLTAIELLGIPAFRDHFTTQVPALDQSIKIRSVTVLFTDLIHSTSLYSSVGDLKAYALVKEHFNIMFNQIIDNAGGIIKTIGDAVMAIFQDPTTAIRVSFDLKEKIDSLFSKQSDVAEFGVKIGISHGTALIVNMNHNIDLFGATVNLAARIVNLADKNSITLTPKILDDFEVQKFLAREKYTVKTLKEQVKGIPGITDVVLLRLE